LVVVYGYTAADAPGMRRRLCKQEAKLNIAVHQSKAILYEDAWLVTFFPALIMLLYGES
jgi:hypothetical protein